MTQQLAIMGGKPVLPEGPPSWPTTTTEIERNVVTALQDHSWGKYEAQWTDQLCAELSKYFQSEHVMLASSGTIAVELALRGIGVRSGDEVILAGYDFPGNFRAIEEIGATPVLVDLIKDGWVMDPNTIPAAISEKTKAVIVSHLHGQIADIESIRSAVNNPDILILEDNCQCPGANLAEQRLGSLGDVGVLSFGGSKLLSAGRGGAVLTNHADILQRAKIFANRGNEAFPLSQLQAAVLLPQLDTLNGLTQLRNDNVQSLLEWTAEIEQLTPLAQPTLGCDHLSAFYKLPWLLKNPTQGGWNRDDFIKAIQAEGVAIDAAFRGFTRRSARRCRKPDNLVNSQFVATQTVLLHHPVLLEPKSTIEKVAEAIRKVLSHDPI